MTDLLKHSFSLNENASTTMVGDEMVILHLDSGVYFGLDEVGAKIWTRINNGQSAQTICAAIAEEYGEPREQIEADTRYFLENLLQANLINASPVK